MKFSKEPIIWIGAIIAIAMVVRDCLIGNLNIESLDALAVAISALIGRQLVVPNSKYVIAKDHAVHVTAQLNRFNGSE